MLYQPVKIQRLFLNIVRFLNKFLTNEENIIYCSRVHFLGAYHLQNREFIQKSDNPKNDCSVKYTCAILDGIEYNKMIAAVTGQIRMRKC